MSSIEAAARRLVGSRFRLHGRDPETGLDCVGVVAAATGIRAPTGYALRGGDPKAIAERFAAVGLQPVQAAGPGDILLMHVGLGQLHMGVRTTTGFVHADAGLRRVVERPGEPEWEIVGSWRRLF